jgi:RimJ/RimL family protein N-acetyltransferase
LTHPPGQGPAEVVVVVRRGARPDGVEYLLREPSLPPRTPRSTTRLVCSIPAPGEPLYAAAVRALREVGIDGAEVWAVDLAAPAPVFACDVPDDTLVGGGFAWLDGAAATAASGTVARVDAVPRVSIGFRAMTRADFPDVVRWQAEPHVARWWTDDAPDVPGAERHYGPALDGTDPTRMWVVEVNGRSVGFVQDYLIGDHPEWALLTGAVDAIGFDYAIGEPAWVGRGIGTRMLWSFLRDVVRPHYVDATTYFASPDHRNVASLRVLDKIGLTRGTWFDETQPDGRVDTVVGCSLDVRRVLG